MKKIILVILLFLNAAFVFAQQPDNKETLKQLNRGVIAAYNQSNYDEALKIARQALDLSVKAFGEESLETAISYKYVGFIYQKKGKFRDSIENLRKSLEIYQKNEAQNGKYLADVYEALAISYVLAGKKKEAEENYLKSLEWNEKIFGKDSKIALDSNLAVAEFYAAAGESDNSDRYFLRSYEVAIKNFGKKSDQIEKIHDARICAIGGSVSRMKKFNEQTREIFAGDEEVSVLNFRATNLPKPDYPSAAKAARASGSVPVKVWVDEKGNVTQAKTVCGHPLLQQSAREAAMKSKFKPATKDGKPISAQGFLFYTFLAM